ncbi:ATP-binding cassette domain-containing protein [Fluviispira multicolorata]|uniref:ATP-binding cassette domain-containing protein n=1 Tax=Fluviispira multicolorata TaxID=2654512 RepID=A0A833JE39_9BACT|nr:ABC transporter ATP-binding protein [Fluviispira multicolorata]KAB8032208.1 ATP-binding cassette domain-containing protein [Fluviispira multicolorata]
MNSQKTTLWQKFSFSDVTPVMKKLAKHSIDKSDLKSVPFINDTLAKGDDYPDFETSLKDLRQSPFKALIKYERKQFVYMFCIHITDVITSLISALAAIQLLRSFEKSSSNFKLINLFYHESTPNQTLIFTIALAVVIFLLKILAASLHAQKIEKEMLLSWRIPFKLMQSLYLQLLRISKRDRSQYQSGDITNLAQNDSRFLGNFLAHALVDIPVLIVSCALVLILMISILGNVAWIGFAVICIQIPLSLFFSWIGNILHEEMMKRGDKRLQLITEWIQGMRLIRYFGWGKYFKEEINQATLSEFIQDIKITVKYCFAFALTLNWWMVVSSAIFAGIVYFNGQKSASTIFAAIWLSSILGQQITPLPWFVNAWSQALVASRRLKSFYKMRIQEEEFNLENSIEYSEEEIKLIDKIINKKVTDEISISFSIKNVSLRFSENEPYVLKDINIEIPAKKTLAIIGPVASGKSLLIQVLMGDIIPNSGEVLFFIHINDSQYKINSITGNVHTSIGLQLLRSIQSYVPQEAFIISSSIRENIPLKYKYIDENYENENAIMNSLYVASFHADLKGFSHGIDTEIGERGVNLSGGQKQRISLSRSSFANSSLIFLDDPLSAVDVKTEKELAQNIFQGEWGKEKTVIWSTHRLDFLKYTDEIIFLDNGKISEIGTYKELKENINSRLNQFILGLNENDRKN